MKKTIALVLIILSGLVAATIPALAQSNATTNLNSIYAQWMTFSTNAVTATSQTLVPTTCYVNTASFGAGAHLFFPFATNASVTIIDGSSTETITPSAVSAPAAATTGANPYNCSFTATFGHAHAAGVEIISGDLGVAEAANDQGRAYPMTLGAILLSGKCTGTVGAGASFISGLSGWDPTQVLSCATAFAPTTGAGTSIPRAGILQSLNVSAGTAGSAAGSGVVTVYKNGTALSSGAGTTMTCTIGTTKACSDLTDTVAVAAGDVISIAVLSPSGGSDALAAVTATAVVY